jgi:hypothetical protein
MLASVPPPEAALSLLNVTTLSKKKLFLEEINTKVNAILAEK